MDNGSRATESVRRALSSSTDPRVARTRAAIAAAVQDLGTHHVELSVAAIARAAGISRASFYTHFAGLDELAQALTRDAFASISDLWSADEGDPVDAMRRSQRRLVDHYLEHRGLYAMAASLPVSKDAYLGTVRAMAGLIEQVLEAHPARPADLEMDAVARYIASAAIGLIDAWLTGDVALDDEALVEHLVRLLPPWFSGLR